MTEAVPPCQECRKPAEMGLTSEGRRLWFCIACARKLAKRLRLPAVTAAVDDAERRLKERS